MNKPNPISHLRSSTPWEQSNNPIWIVSNISLKRNLASFPFPIKMSPKESEATLGTFKQSLINTPFLETPTFFEMETLKNEEKEYLFDHFLIRQDSKCLSVKTGALFDQSGHFLALINSEDHLTLHAIDGEPNWEKSWEKLCKIETNLSKKHIFAYSEKFGYLTSELTNSGTGLTLQTFLHLPCLIHLDQIDTVIIKELDKEFLVSGLSGQETFIGDIVVIQNRFTIGLTENHILEGVHHAATKLINLEKMLRSELRESPDPLIIDKVSRSIGLLMHAYQIEIKEALSALSFIKLGIDLEWVVGLSTQEITKIFFEVRRSHISLFASEEISPDQLPYERAKFLQKVLKPLMMK